jgi:acyl-CoA thioester hydrolase
MKPAPNRLVLANYPLAIEVPARFSDLDPNHHLNNVAIGHFYEEGRADMQNRALRKVAREAGLPPLRLMLAHGAISYLAEGRYPAVLTVASGILQVGRTSFTYGHGLFCDGECIGVAEFVAVNRDDGGPAPIAAVVRDAMLHLAIAGSTAAEQARTE